jgi:hypothetical protein
MRRHALRLVLLATLLVLVLSACGGGGSSQEQAKARPLPEDEKALRPGEYRSEEFKPSFSFTVGKGWSIEPPELPGLLYLPLSESASLSFWNVQEVYKPSGDIHVVPAPDDMVGWFQRHPHLQTDEPEQTTVGGVKGEQFDVVVGDLPEDYYAVCGTGCVDIAKFGGDWIAFAEGYKERVVVLEDVKGETVIIDFGSRATEFDELAPEAQKVIDSVEWEGA